MKKFSDILTWTIIIVITGVAIYQVFLKDWASLFVTVQALVIGLLPYFLERKFNIFTPHALRTSFVVFMFATLILGEIADFYNTYWWWDIALHTYSSAGITIIGFILLVIGYRSKEIKSSAFFTSFLAFSFAMSVAVLWEIYEFTVDSLVELETPMQLSNRDTMGDLIVATIGALIVCVYGYRYVKKRNRTGVIESIIDEGKINNQTPTE